MLKNISVYVYPNIPRNDMGSHNPYIENLKLALSANEFMIDQHTAPNAFLDLIRNGSRSDILILNWMEDLPLRRFGIIQTGLLPFYLLFLKLKRKKIIWIKHNKLSHEKKFFRLKSIIQYLLLHGSNRIIIHSSDSNLSASDKIRFIHHPNNINENSISVPDPEEQPVIDLLLWGTILPYKGILEFLQYVRTHPGLHSLKIHIEGECDADYFSKLETFRNPNITLVNRYIDQNDLSALFKATRFILFTYKQDSVMSSGILIDSLVSGKRIIAPNFGAFRDLAATNDFIAVYDDFSGIAGIYKEYHDRFLTDPSELRQFLKETSWENTGKKIKELVSE